MRRRAARGTERRCPACVGRHGAFRPRVDPPGFWQQRFSGRMSLLIVAVWLVAAAVGSVLVGGAS